MSATTSPQSTSPATARRPGRRILIVDDNIDAVEPLRDLLEHEGHHVRIAMEPAAALEVARQFRPEVALLDIELPIMDGYELGHLLRELPQLHDCTLIALTGYSRDHNRRRISEAGFEHYLVKPIDDSLLLRIIGAPSSS